MSESAKVKRNLFDLIHGDELADKLKEMSLGVTTEMVEHVVVDEDWFAQI